MQKRTRFFVIVFDEQSSEEEMQEAFEKVLGHPLRLAT